MKMTKHVYVIAACNTVSYAAHIFLLPRPVVDLRKTAMSAACRGPFDLVARRGGGGALTLERGMGMCRGHDPPFFRPVAAP